jgi:spore maturation protein CgeB
MFAGPHVKCSARRPFKEKLPNGSIFAFSFRSSNPWSATGAGVNIQMQANTALRQNGFNFFSQRLFQANLQALSMFNPVLARRLCWPVDGSHVMAGEDGEGGLSALINHRGLWCRLNPNDRPGPQARDAAEKFFREGRLKDVLLFGSGIGRYAEALNGRMPPGGTLHLYERDPWLMRLMLMRLDLQKELAGGRVRLYLGSDLMHLRLRRERMHVFMHPVLSRIYHNERAFYEKEDFEKSSLRVLVGEGTLFVDDICEVLRSMGNDVLPWLPRQVSADELSYQIAQFSPHAVFQVNYLHGLAPFVQGHGTTFLCWEIDPAVDLVSRSTAHQDRTFIFTYNPLYVESYQKAGFENAVYLPLGTNIRKRRPIKLSPAQEMKYGSDISFVGASMAEQGRDLESIFLKIPPSMFEGKGEGKTAREIFGEIVRLQDSDSNTYRVPDILAEYISPGIDPVFEHDGTRFNIEMLVAETSAMKRRSKIVSGLARYGINVWGDRGWESIAGRGVLYRGYAGHESELGRIYNASGINLDINRLFQRHIVTMRVFDVLACGGFMLAEHSSALEDLFDVGREIISYRSVKELHCHVDYYLRNPQLRREISMAGREAVLKRHGMESRIASMLATAGLN